MKNKILLILPLVFMFSLITACHQGIPSPDFAFIEVLDETDNVIEDCSFSATYNGNEIEDLYVDFSTMNDEEFAKSCITDGDGEHRTGFKIGKSIYTLGTLIVTDEQLAGKDLNAILSKIKVTVSKEGYVSQEYTLLTDDMVGSYIRKTIILKTQTE